MGEHRHSRRSPVRRHVRRPQAGESALGSAGRARDGHRGLRAAPRLATGAGDSRCRCSSGAREATRAFERRSVEPGQTTNFNGNQVQTRRHRAVRRAEPFEFDTDVDTGTGPKTRTGPRVAMNTSPDGREGVAAWAINDGEGDRVQVSLLTPYDPETRRRSFPPPPPPRPAPKPAVASPIQLARPTARDQATVLKTATRLRRALGSCAGASAPRASNHRRQDRGRQAPAWCPAAPARHLEGSARSRRARRTKTYTRSFTSFKPSLTGEVMQVQRGLDQAIPLPSSRWATRTPSSATRLPPAPRVGPAPARCGRGRAQSHARPQASSRASRRYPGA